LPNKNNNNNWLWAILALLGIGGAVTLFNAKAGHTNPPTTSNFTEPKKFGCGCNKGA
jgi:hypothetical protein